MSELVKSAARAMEIVELLTARGPLGFTEICQELSLPRSSAHGLLTTMREHGFLTMDETSRCYGIGLRLWEAGQRYLRDLDVVAAAMPSMKRIRAELGETVQLAVLDGIENVYIGKLEGHHPLQLVSHVGSRLPAYSTGLGKALLAELPDDEVEARFADVPFQRFTDSTLAGVPVLLAELRAARDRGYATDRGEFSPGVFCVAAVLRGVPGTTVAVSVSIPDIRASAETRRRAVDVVRQESTALSTATAGVSAVAR